MAKLLKLGLVILMSVAVVGCSKSDEEKAEDMVNEYQSLQRELNSMGTPTTSWSEQKLNDYIRKLDRLSSLEAQAESNDNIVVYGSNARAIATNRRIAERALAEKRRMASLQEKNQQFETLYDEYKTLHRQLQEKRESFDSGLSDDDLNVLVTDSDVLIEKVRQLLEVIDGTSRSYSNKRDIKQLLNEQLESYRAIKAVSQEELNKRAAALDVEAEETEDAS